jgi:hypothetical protein
MALGIDAAKAVLNCRTRDLLKETGASPRFVGAEEAEQMRDWAEEDEGEG